MPETIALEVPAEPPLQSAVIDRNGDAWQSTHADLLTVVHRAEEA